MARPRWLPVPGKGFDYNKCIHAYYIRHDFIFYCMFSWVLQGKEVLKKCLPHGLLRHLRSMLRRSGPRPGTSASSRLLPVSSGNEPVAWKSLRSLAEGTCDTLERSVEVASMRPRDPRFDDNSGSFDMDGFSCLGCLDVWRSRYVTVPRWQVMASYIMLPSRVLRAVAWILTFCSNSFRLSVLLSLFSPRNLWCSVGLCANYAASSV